LGESREGTNAGGMKNKAGRIARSNGELLRAVFDNTGDLILAYRPGPEDSGGKILAANSTACQILGYTREALLQAGPQAIGLPEYPIHRPEVPQTLYRQGLTLREAELLTRDRTRLPVEINARRLALSGEDVIILVARDIRSRKQMEKDLRVRREWFKAALSSIGDAVIATDAAGRIVFCNQIAETLTGFTRAEADGKPLAAVFRLLDPETGQAAAFPLSGTNGAVSPGKACDRLLKAKNGKKFAIAVTATPIAGDDGETLGTVIAFQDITEREDIEKKLLYRLRVEEAMAAVGKILNSQEAADFPRILSILGKAVGVSRAYIYQFREQYQLTDKTAEWCAAGVASKLRETQGIRSNDFPWFTQKILAREVVVINDTADVPPEAAAERRFYSRLQAKALLCVPVCAPAGEVIGYLGFANTAAARVWLKEDINLLQTVAVMVGAYYGRKQSDERIRYMSYHDKLTGLFNKAFFEEETSRLGASRQLPVSIIIGDVNGLKFVNDAFGHQEGDVMLMKVADVMRASCRSEDILARWGGDEFAVLLPNTSEEAALGIVRRMQKAVAELAIAPIKLSIALGAAAKTSPAQDIKAVLREAEDRMYRNKLLGSDSVRGNIITSLGKSLWERSYETEEHAMRLRDIAIYFGRKLALPAGKLDELSLLAMLHDIGKIGIPDDILRKTGPLTAEEFEIMKKHPEIGYRITSSAPELAPVSYGVMTHHESWDGTGYPHGLKGEEIPLIARIIAIIDAYDTMLHSRIYGPAKNKAEALSEIKACAGAQFDPRLVERFIELIDGFAPQAEAAAGKEEE